MTTFSNTAMYALTVQSPTATQEAIVGDFLGNGRQQILTINGSRISIIEVTRRQRGFQEVFSQDVFAIVRHVAKFRLAGSTKGEWLLIRVQLPILILEGTARSSNAL